MNKAALDKLGERICASDLPHPEDVERLARFTDEHLDGLEKADELMRSQLGLVSGSRVDGTDLTVSNRLKRDRRIREKLERDTKLSRIQDIVGFRVVGHFTLTHQSELAERIRVQMIGKTIDRRAAPSYGYRAVHVVANVDGFWMEFQVRTFLQDYWANGMEALSRRWGRQIQYGEPPTYSSTRTLIRRTQAIGQYRSLADQIMKVEARMDALVHGQPRNVSQRPASEPRDILIHSLRSRRGHFTRAMKQFKTEVDRFLELALAVDVEVTA